MDDDKEEYSFPTLLNKFDNKENKKLKKGLSPKLLQIRRHAHTLLSTHEEEEDLSDSGSSSERPIL